MRVTSWVACAALMCACAETPMDEEATADERGASDESIGEVESALANNQQQSNSFGGIASFSTMGSIASTGPYFDSLGTNGRRCVDCHQPDQGFSITPSRLAMLFARTAGLDPVFRPSDGAVSPTADVSTPMARRSAYKNLLGRGVIRVGLPIPQNAEFELVEVDDPAGYASAAELSLFRRPLPATNLRYQTAVMWDGRESPAGRTLDDALLQQAEDATLGHAQASFAPSAAQKRAIVDFESSNYTAQIRDAAAGSLFDPANGVLGGPEPLSSQPFAPGMNDAFGGGLADELFDPRVFTIFDGFSPTDAGTAELAARAAIARGQDIFNTKPLVIRNVGGINDDPSLGSPATLAGTCSTCHSAPNVGSSSLPRFFNIGIGTARSRLSDYPLYTLREKATGATIQTTDPGRALITGRWADIQRFKVPSLRGLAARAPYFHNGQALTLQDVVDFYNGRFAMAMSDQEKSDLIAFLRAL